MDDELSFIAARYLCYNKLHEWMKAGLVSRFTSTPHHLAELLGYRDIESLIVCEKRDEVMHTLKLLNGEHGFAVYKMLLAKRGVDGVH